MNWVLLVLLSAVLFAAGNIIRKHVLCKEHALEFLAARGFFVIILLLVLAPWVDMSISLRSLGLIFVASLVATFGYYSQTQAQRHTDISFFSPVQNFAPVVVLVVAFLFLHETVTVVQLFGVAGVVIGGSLLASETGSWNPFGWLRQKYWLHILAAVVLLGVAAVLDKYIIGSIDPITYLFFAWLFMHLSYILLDWWRYDWTHIAVDLQKGWYWLLLTAVLGIASMLTFYQALRLPSVFITLALPLRRVSTLLETLFGGTLFHERHLARRIFASVVMLVGIVLVAS